MTYATGLTAHNIIYVHTKIAVTEEHRGISAHTKARPI